MLVHGLFVLGLDSNLFEFKWNGLNGLSVERKKEKKKDRQKSPAAHLGPLFPLLLPHGPRRPSSPFSPSGLSFLFPPHLGHAGPACPVPQPEPRARSSLSLFSLAAGARVSALSSPPPRSFPVRNPLPDNSGELLCSGPARRDFRPGFI
jgi:hypothetical protein